MQDNNMPAQQPKWDRHQVALLVDTYINIEKGIKNRRDAIIELSELLRAHAIQQGIEISGTYRNISGISMRLEELRYLFSNGEKGIKHYSAVEKEVVWMYNNYNKGFCQLLSEAKQIYNIEKIEDINNENYENISVDDLDITKRTLNCLKVNGIDNLKQLLDIDIDGLRTRRQIGDLTVQEIKDVILNYASSLQDVNQNKENEITVQHESINDPDKIDKNRYVVKKTEEIKTIGELSKEYFYKIEDVFHDEWVLRYCKKFGLKNIGLLANKFPDIFIADDEIMAQDIYFEKESLIRNTLDELGIEKPPIKLTPEQYIVLNKRSIEECYSENYVNNLISTIEKILTSFGDYEGVLSKKNKLTNNEVYVLFQRNGIKLNKKYTLEEISKKMGISRERVRQIESKATKKVQHLLNKTFVLYNMEIYELLNNLGEIIYCQNTFEIDYTDLLNNILKREPDRCFDIDFEHNVIVKKGSSLNILFSSLYHEIKAQGKNFFSLDEIKNQIRIFLLSCIKKDNPIAETNYLYLYNLFWEYVTKKYFIMVNESLYKFKASSTKNSNKDKLELIEYHFKNIYKEAVSIPQRDEAAIKFNLAELYKQLPWLNEYKGTSSLERNIKDIKNIIFWGMGKYIHIDNTNADMDIVEQMINVIQCLFQKGKRSIDPLEFYKKHHFMLEQANIPDQYALMGLLKYKNPVGINCDIRGMTIYPTAEIYSIEIDDISKNDIDKDTKDKFVNVLNDFKRGLRYDSPIDLKRFKTEYENKYESIELSDKDIIKNLQTIGIVYNNFVYSYRNIITEELTYEIDDYIVDTLSKGCNVLYIESIYRKFEDKFFATNIFNIEMLKAFLEYYYNGSEYYVNADYITLDINADHPRTKKLLIT